MLPPFRYILIGLVLGSLSFVTLIRGASAINDHRLARLDTLVGLTPAQKVQAAAAFQAESDAIDALAPSDRLTNGSAAREKCRREIRALLSTEQRRKYDLSPQSVGGGLRANPDNFVDRLDQLVSLSADQKVRAREILWKEYGDQLAALPPDSESKGFFWREETRNQLRAILTPQQLEKYNTTPVIQGGAGRMTSPSAK